MSQDWTPERGRLVARMECGPDYVRMELCFRDLPGSNTLFKSIAVINGWCARAYVGGFYECMAGKEDRNIGGYYISRDYVSDATLLLFKKLWNDPKVTWEEWLDKVMHDPDLDTSYEWNRLKNLFKDSP